MATNVWKHSRARQGEKSIKFQVKQFYLKENTNTVSEMFGFQITQFSLSVKSTAMKNNVQYIWRTTSDKG